jgi:lysophospholipase L1-like esterase
MKPRNTMKHLRHLSLVTVAVGLFLTGCASSGGSAPKVNNPFSPGGGSTLGEVKVNTMRVFGDSYSDPAYTNSVGTINWATQLQARGTVSDAKIYAIGGARAATGEQRAFNRQIDTSERRGPAIADGDLTVVYLGHNDIGRTGSPDGLRRAASGYQEGLTRLIESGAANEGRRIFLTQLHNWSRGPGVSDGTSGQVRSWNNYLAGLANGNPNIIAVDLYTVFERIVADPGRFGFTNVTTANRSRSAVDALYLDDIHLGSRGQDIIARVYQHYLTRGWDWANSVSAGAEAAGRINEDIDGGTLVLNVSGQQQLQAGLRLVPLGVSSQQAFGFKARNSKVFQPFSNDNADSASAPRGLALDIGLGTNESGHGGRLGVAVFQQDQTRYLSTTAQGNSKQFTSDALALYWNKPVSGWVLSSQLSQLNLNFSGNAQDTLVQRTLENNSKGNTWSFENKVRYPLRSGVFNVTPWMSVTSQSHTLNPTVMSTLYTTDVAFSSNRVNEWLTGVGVDVQSDAMPLGANKSLQFGASLNHTASLSRDAVTVSMQEAGSPGVVQRELFPLAKVERTQLGLQAALNLAKNLQVTATYGTQLQDTRNTSSLMLKANIRY